MLSNSSRLTASRSLLERGRWSGSASARSASGGAADASCDGAGSPCSTWGHTATWLRRPGHADSLLVLGGELLTPGVLSSMRANDGARGARLWRMEADRWERALPAEPGAAPSPRREHAAAAFNGRLVVAGGLGAAGSACGDLWSAGLTRDGHASWEASGLDARWAAVLARHGHSLVATPTGLLLFGGRMAPLTAQRAARAATAEPSDPPAAYGAADCAADADEDGGAELVALNDVWLLEPRPAGEGDGDGAAADEHVAAGPRPLWRAPLPLESPSEVGCPTRRADAAAGGEPATAVDARGASARGWQTWRAKGRAHSPRSAPCGRFGHSAHWHVGEVGGGAGCAAGCMLVFGGKLQPGSARADLWLYRPPPRARRRLAPADDAAARAHAAAAAAAGWQPLRPAAHSERPPPRAAHASCLHPPGWAGGLFVLGGEGAAAAADATGARGARGGQLWRFDLASRGWAALYTPQGAPRPPNFDGATLSPPAAQPPADGAVEAAPAAGAPAAAPGALLLLGGTGGLEPKPGPRVALMTEWQWALGVDCWPACPNAQSCDTTAGTCVCELGAACQALALETHASDYRGAWSLVGKAWAVVGISVAGALVGASAHKVSEALRRRRQYRRVG